MSQVTDFIPLKMAGSVENTRILLILSHSYKKGKNGFESHTLR